MSVIKLSDIDSKMVADYHAALVRIATLETALRNLLEALDLRRDWQPLQPAIDAAKAALSGARTAKP